MLEPGTFKGARGRVQLGYATAAEVAPFLVTFDREKKSATVLTGTVTTAHPFLVTQAPLVFVVPTKLGFVRWPIETITITNGQVVARLGALLEEPHVAIRSSG